MKCIQRRMPVITPLLLIFFLLMTGSVSAQDISDAPNPVIPPYPPLGLPDQPLQPDPPFEGTFDIDSVTACDAAAPTFIGSGMLVRATSKYVNGEVTAGTSPTNGQFALGMNVYINNILPSARQMIDSPDPNLDGASVSGNSLYLVSGDPICVADPRFDNAVAVFYRLFRFNVPDAVGYVRESLHWSGIQPRTLASGTIEPFTSIPDFTLNYLSVYFLEPTGLNPDVANQLPLYDPSGGIRYCGGDGAPSFISTGEDAILQWSVGVTPGFADELADAYGIPAYNEIAENYGYSEEEYNQNVLDYIYLVLNQQQEVLGGWFGIFMEPAGLLYDGTVLPQNTIFPLIMDGPVCTEYQIMSDVPDLLCAFAGDIGPYSVDCSLGDLYGGYTIVTTWWQVEVEYNGLTLGGGWFPESQAVFHKDEPEEVAFYYYMQPYDTVTGSEMGTDRPITGNPGANYSFENEANFVDVLQGVIFSCPSDILPARVAIGGVAHAIAPQLNVRSSPNGEVIGSVSNTVALTILNGPICKDGYRWWYVQPQTASIAGWVSEADSSVYYIEPGMPIPPTPIPPTAAPPPIVTADPASIPDTDGDGVLDPNDACPTQGTEVSGVVGPDGCPILPG